MYKTDPSMSTRLAEEIWRSQYSNKQLAYKIGCNPATVSYWLSGGGIPHAYYLARFHKIGFDVIYILTGERTRND